MYESIREKSEHIFLHPSPTYKYDTIISGCNVLSSDGRYERMYAVARNTWRGFHRIDKDGIGAGNIFMTYFTKNKNYIISCFNISNINLQFN